MNFRLIWYKTFTKISYEKLCQSRYFCGHSERCTRKRVLNPIVHCQWKSQSAFLMLFTLSLSINRDSSFHCVCVFVFLTKTVELHHTIVSRSFGSVNREWDSFYFLISFLIFYFIPKKMPTITKFLSISSCKNPLISKYSKQLVWSNSNCVRNAFGFHQNGCGRVLKVNRHTCTKCTV